MTSFSLGAVFCVSSLRCAFNALIYEMICSQVGVVVVFCMECLFLFWDVSDLGIFETSHSAFGRVFGTRVISTMGICVFIISIGVVLWYGMSHVVWLIYVS